MEIIWGASLKHNSTDSLPLDSPCAWLSCHWPRTPERAWHSSRAGDSSPGATRRWSARPQAHRRSRAAHGAALRRLSSLLRITNSRFEEVDTVAEGLYWKCCCNNILTVCPGGTKRWELLRSAKLQRPLRLWLRIWSYWHNTTHSSLCSRWGRLKRCLHQIGYFYIHRFLGKELIVKRNYWGPIWHFYLILFFNLLSLMLCPFLIYYDVPVPANQSLTQHYSSM